MTLLHSKPLPMLESFLTWKSTALPGTRFEYHRGFLPDALQGVNGQSQRDARNVRPEIVGAYLSGMFELVQKRHDYLDYSYIVVRRRVKDPQIRWWHREEKNVPAGASTRGKVERRLRLVAG